MLLIIRIMLLNNYQLGFFNIDATTLKPRIQHWTLKAGQLMTLRHLRCWWGCLMTSWSLWHLVRAGGQSATTFMWSGPPAEQRALKPGLYFIQRPFPGSLWVRSTASAGADSWARSCSTAAELFLWQFALENQGSPAIGVNNLRGSAIRR